MIKRYGFAVLGLTAGLVGCQAAPEEHGSFLLLDRGAREAGFAVDGDSDKSPVLPVELEPSVEIELVGPSGRIAVVPEADELLHVHGPDGMIERRKLEHGVDLDRIHLDASEQAAKELADVLGGTAEKLDDGRWEVRAENALGEASRVRAPEGLLEAFAADAADPDAPANKVMKSGAGRAATWAQGRNAKSAAKGALGDKPILALADLLPPAVSCADPVAGVWVSHEHHDSLGEWYSLKLTIRRDPANPSTLVGEIRSEFWNGGADQIEAPSCDVEAYSHGLVTMQARGKVTNGKLSFGGTSWRAEQMACKHSWSHQYNLDQFTGDVNGSTFMGVNNDGGRSVDDPVSFRRIACH